MKKTIFLFAMSFVAGICTSTAQSEQDQRISSAYILAFGRIPTGGELGYWRGQGNLSIGQMVDGHKRYLVQDVGTHNTTIDRAYVDALGRNANSGELEYWRRGDDTYTTLMKNHLSYLQGNPDEYRKVIRRSYQYVFGRKPTDGEVGYWQGQPKITYLVLVAYHQDYQRRNQSVSFGNLMPSNASVLVNSTPVNAAVAREAATVAGLSTIVAAGGGNIVAAGGGNIVAAGGGNIVAAGGGNIVAAGGGN